MSCSCGVSLRAAHLYGELTLCRQRRDGRVPSLLSLYSAFFRSRTVSSPLVPVIHTLSLRDDGTHRFRRIRMEHHPLPFPGGIHVVSVRVYTVRFRPVFFVQRIQREDHDAARLCDAAELFTAAAASARADDPERPGRPRRQMSRRRIRSRGYRRFSALPPTPLSPAGSARSPRRAMKHQSRRQKKAVCGELHRIRPAAAARVTDGFDSVPVQRTDQRIRCHINRLNISRDPPGSTRFQECSPKAFHSISFSPTARNKTQSKPNGVGSIRKGRRSQHSAVFAVSRKRNGVCSFDGTKSKPNEMGSIWKGKTTPSVDRTPPAAADDLKHPNRSPTERVRFGKRKKEPTLVQFSPQGGNGTVLAPSDVLARLPGLEPGTSGLGAEMYHFHLRQF